jgi:uncharacterized protein
MKFPRLRRSGLAALLLAYAVTVLAQVAVPPLSSRVTDVVGTLTTEQRTALEQRLAAFEARKGTQIAVVIVPTTQPEEIEQFGIRVAEQWKIGRKGVDDGAILVIAINDRRLRIEVGYGLEGVLTDATAKRIVDEHIVPRFKQKDYFGGIDAGVTRLMAVIEGEPLPPPKAAGRAAPASDGGFESFLMVAFVLVFIVGGVLRAVLGRFVGSSVIAGLAGAAGWLMLGSIIAAVFVALVALFLSLMGGLGGMGGFGRRGGWYGGFPGGGGWTGGGGGGSWGGGGGGFGGGGASGRW